MLANSSADTRPHIQTTNLTQAALFKWLSPVLSCCASASHFVTHLRFISPFHAVFGLTRTSEEVPEQSYNTQYKLLQMEIILTIVVPFAFKAAEQTRVNAKRQHLYAKKRHKMALLWHWRTHTSFLLSILSGFNCFMSALYSLFCALQPPSTHESVCLNEETTMRKSACVCVFVGTHRSLWHGVAGGNECILLQ